jgi:hypothetical protein
VYADQLGVELADVEYSSALAGEDVTAAVGGALGPGGPGWTPVAPADAQALDVALYRLSGRPWHVGVVVAPGMVLHAPGPCRTTVVERMGQLSLRRRLVGCYRLAVSNTPPAGGGFVKGAAVQVAGRDRPFGRRIDAQVPAGGNLVEVLAAAGLEAHPLLRLFVGAVEVPRDHWRHVRPKAGRVVTVAAVPTGGSEGGKGALRIVATLALIAGAAVLGPALVPALGTVGSAIVVGAATIGVTLAMNALAPPSKSRLGTEDQASPTIAGARNEARPYEPWVDVLGFHRLVPPYAAMPYTEVSGDDQYLRLLFDCGYGPKELSDLQIGETALEEFDGVEVETRAGHPDDEPIRLFPDTVFEDPLQVLLEESAGWSLRTTAAGADEISVDVLFPTGLARIRSDGGRDPFSVGVLVEYSPTGLGVWTRVNGDAGAAGSPTEARQMDFLFRTPEVQRGGGVHITTAVEWGLGFPRAKPAYLPATNYSWVVEGWFRDPDAPENGGLYQFGVDGSDAIDLEVDGRMVVSWYGSHEPAGGPAAPPNYAAHASAPVRLSRGWHRVRLRVEARSTTGAVALGWVTPASGGAWATIPGGPAGSGGVFRLQADSESSVGLAGTWYDTSVYTSTIGVTAEQATPIRRSLAWAVPRGQYDVRLRRITPDSEDTRLLDDVYWSALRTITNENPVTAPGRALVAMRIKATDQLNGVIDNFSVMVRSVVQDWDAGEGLWVVRATNNPASLYRYLLQGAVNARPLSDARIDLEELQAWHEACADDGWAFNAVLDFPGTVFERLSDVAAAGRASFGMREGLYSVVRDRPQTVPVQVITPRNSYGFRGRKVFPEQVHCLRVQFLDETNGYQRDERLVLNDGYQIGGLDAFGNPAPLLPPATKFETLELFGVTSPELVWRQGRYHLAVSQLRPETIELGMDVEHLACTRGDLVLLSHYAWGETQSVGARVTALVVDSGGDLRGVVVDETITMDAGVQYGIRVRKADGTIFQAALAISGSGGEYTRLDLTGPVSAGAPHPEVGDLAVVGLLGLETREMVVQRIEPDSNLAARLTLVDHAPAVHLADVGEIPAWDPGVRSAPIYHAGPETPVIEDIRSDDWVMVRQGDGSYAPRMVIILRRPSSQRPLPVEAEVGIRQSNGGAVGPPLPFWYRRLPLTNSTVTLDQVEVGTTYDIRLRVITRLGRTSAWVEAEHTVLGNVLPPPDVASFSVTQLADGTRRYTFDLGVIPPDIAGVLIRYTAQTASPVWESMTRLHTEILEGASPWEALIPGAGLWTFGIKMIDTAGNESVNAIFTDAILTEVADGGFIRSENARAMNWPGTLTDCQRISDRFGPVLEAIDDTTWDGLAAIGVTSWDLWSRWNMQPRSPISYVHTMDIGAVVAATPWIEYGVSGAAEVTFEWSIDGVAWSGPLSVEQAIVRTFEARYFRVTVTVTAHPSSGFYVPRITELTIRVRGIAVEQFLNDIDTAELGAGYRLGVGDFRVPLDPERFGVVSHVNVTFNGTGAGWTYEMVDRSTSPGPRLRLYGPDDLPADAVVDVYVRGFGGDAPDDPGATSDEGMLDFSDPNQSGWLAGV